MAPLRRDITVLKARRGSQRAVVAVALGLLRTIYAFVTGNTVTGFSASTFRNPAYISYIPHTRTYLTARKCGNRENDDKNEKPEPGR